ncbi:anthranilate synthase component II [Bacillus benzoevorans]|uniref:Anthranilate synthase/aminodeoxychorismate synthase-like glutamine amidotransferase n=1 Tax=Bacillus benzoevorans TaxID=1456 RepID=A0A7X0HVG2_9BACI|nr:aminodeoxychorismate/anthranilate synthase component II [Bacillus benzoevorans]MBB6446360.1 anthranilate synthase/aminodeoxychorismate synthase-like glutamine amidotransferase [Bacillus benzoevorans]
MILLIDNYDSFTYNLYQYIGELGEALTVKRNDEITVEDIEQLNPEAIIISPGPGRPENAGNTVEIIKQFYKKIPILGICLGHQAIGYSFGAVIEKAGKIMHGKTSKIRHGEKTLFQSMPQGIEVMRYHSLVIKKGTLPPYFDVLAESADDGEIMALKHCHYPLYGMQFHPESVGTGEGKQLLNNFLSEMRKEVL